MEVVSLSTSTSSNSPTDPPQPPPLAPLSTHTSATQQPNPAPVIASPTRKRQREFGQTPPLSPAAIPKKTTPMSPTATVPVVALTGAGDAAASVTANHPVVHNGHKLAVDETDQAAAAAQQYDLNGGFADVPLPSTSAALIGVGGSNSSSSCGVGTLAEITVRLLVLITCWVVEL